MSKESKSYKNSLKKIHIRTFGCQMNVRDSEIIFGILQKRGFSQAFKESDADIILFNTCSVRKQAEDRVWSNVGMLKKRQIKPIVGIVGCMAQNYQNKIFRRAQSVDFVCGPANIYDIPDLIEKALHRQKHLLAVEKKQRPLKCDYSFKNNSAKAFISIMHGCDNFCSYCIVPFVRGREKSRPIKHILSEVKKSSDKGCREITLLGQNVNSYGRDLEKGTSFTKLLEKLNRLKGIERIRFVTSHPKDATDELFKAMRDLPKVCEHLHLPLQSGSDKILQVMNRKYTLSAYMKLVDSLRNYMPGSSITTDIIVGFPGETKEDFKKTKQTMKKICFDEAFIFKYSPRPQTKAAELADDVAKEEKLERNHELLRLQESISLEKNKALIGTCLEVFIEGEGSILNKDVKKKAHMGRTRTHKIVLFPKKINLISKTVHVKIKRSTAHTLIGENLNANS